MAVCEPRPSLAPCPDNLALLSEGTRLSLGEPLACDRAHGHKDVNVDVQPVACLRRMDRPVRDETLAGEVFADKIPHKKNLLCGRQLVGKCYIEAMGKLGILRTAAVAFDVIKPVPKLGAIVNP